MEKDDTAFRYFQNIASWSARAEIHLMYDKKDARDWRPECVDYIIDENKKWTNFQKKGKFNDLRKEELQKLKILFAFDKSGSVSGKKEYFKEIDKILKEYYKNGDKLYLWGDQYIEKTKTEIDKWIKEEYGSGGTYTSNIVELANINLNHREHLIIVTDGIVEENEIKKSDELMTKYKIKFAYVSIFIIGNSGNLSVGAPFCRDCPNRTINVIDSTNIINGPTLSLEQFSSFKGIDNIKTLLEFNSHYENLYSVIFAKQLGKTTDIDIKNKLEKLKVRIINKLNDKEKKEFENKWNDLYDMAEKGTHNYNIGTAGKRRDLIK